MSFVATDILGPILESDTGNSYILVVGGLLYTMDGGLPHPKSRGCHRRKEDD